MLSLIWLRPYSVVNLPSVIYIYFFTFFFFVLMIYILYLAVASTIVTSLSVRAEGASELGLSDPNRILLLLIIPKYFKIITSGSLLCTPKLY